MIVPIGAIYRCALLLAFSEYSLSSGVPALALSCSSSGSRLTMPSVRPAARHRHRRVHRQCKLCRARWRKSGRTHRLLPRSRCRGWSPAATASHARCGRWRTRAGRATSCTDRLSRCGVQSPLAPAPSHLLSTAVALAGALERPMTGAAQTSGDDQDIGGDKQDASRATSTQEKSAHLDCPRRPLESPRASSVIHRLRT